MPGDHYQGGGLRMANPRGGLRGAQRPSARRAGLRTPQRAQRPSPGNLGALGSAFGPPGGRSAAATASRGPMSRVTSGLGRNAALRGAQDQAGRIPRGARRMHQGRRTR